MSEKEIATRMGEAALAWLEALGAEQRARASFAFEDETERTDWAYFPRGHKGLPLHDQDLVQRKLAHTLIAASLSAGAYAKVNAIMALESVLNEMEGRRLDALRDPARYFLSVFDGPGEERWGWRLEGHHVSLNYTIAGGAVVSATPLFLGANPAEVRHGSAAVLRPCGEEEDAARELLLSLDGEQRGAAVLCEAAPPDFVLTNVPYVPASSLPGEGAAQFLAPLFEGFAQKEALRLDRDGPRGVAGAALDATQRVLLAELIGVYADRLPEPLAAAERARVERAGIEQVHFAWAGEERPRRGHYYRLQGPSFLVEYDNTQNEANHVHAVWRNPGNDFGRDALRGHVRDAH